MTGKKYIVLLVILAVVSLGASAAISLLFGGPGTPAGGKDGAGKKPPSKTDALLAGLAAAGQPREFLPNQAAIEQLIKDLRARTAEYEHKKSLLAQRESRVRQAEENLKRRAKEVEKLRMELIGPLTRLKDAIAEVRRQQVLVDKQEKSNLQRIAGTFEKMDAVKGGAMLAGMCENGQADDAVKILYYMSERMSAKMLAEMPDQALAAKLTGLMKGIQEEG